VDDSLQNLKALARCKRDLEAAQEIPVLAGKLLFESDPSPHRKEWEELHPKQQVMFERAAATLRAQISLCLLCGRQAPLILIANIGLCKSCAQFGCEYLGNCDKAATQVLTFATGERAYYCAGHAREKKGTSVSEELLPLLLFHEEEHDAN